MIFTNTMKENCDSQIYILQIFCMISYTHALIYATVSLLQSKLTSIY